MLVRDTGIIQRAGLVQRQGQVEQIPAAVDPKFCTRICDGLQCNVSDPHSCRGCPENLVKSNSIEGLNRRVSRSSCIYTKKNPVSNISTSARVVPFPSAGQPRIFPALPHVVSFSGSQSFQR